MLHSIRSRLALSFAGIALVAAVVLGVVLLAILQNYYNNLEFAYLRLNAKAVGGLVDTMLNNAAPHDVVQSQVENLAFLTQTRIRVFGGDGELRYDSGLPQAIDVNLGAPPPKLSMEVNGNAPDIRTFIAVAPKSGQVTASSGTTSASPGTNYVFVYQTNPPGGEAFGFALNAEAITRGARSNKAVNLSVARNGNPLLTVRLSDGPAYGSAILASVARGWAIASAIAVLLAALVGWFVSRRISAPVVALTGVTARMAQGDLSGRAAVRGRDEFGQLARSFNEMADRVETTVTALSQFISDAAHELRTPLTALRTNLDLAQDERDDEARAAFVGQAQVMVTRLDELNTNLLDLSRLAANGHNPRETLVDLADVLRQRSEHYASQAEQAELNLDFDLSPEPVTVRADPSQIGRVMDNLVDNACKFTPPGGTVQVALSRQPGQALFTVTDTGIGIPADELPQLFQRFHRGRNTNPYPGSGLGLAIVKAIVEAHGGSIAAYSTGEGQGSRFTVSLPVASGAPA